MKKVFLLPIILLLALGCSKKNDLQPGPGLRAFARINSPDGIADGCDWYLQINQRTFVASDSTRTGMVAFYRKNSLTRRDSVKIRYQVTGRKKLLFCGWAGGKPENEIDVLELQK